MFRGHFQWATLTRSPLCRQREAPQLPLWIPLIHQWLTTTAGQTPKSPEQLLESLFSLSTLFLHHPFHTLVPQEHWATCSLVCHPFLVFWVLFYLFLFFSPGPLQEASAWVYSPSPSPHPTNLFLSLWSLTTCHQETASKRLLSAPPLYPHVLYYELNVYVPPKFICWSSNFQCDGSWKWGVWQVMSGGPRDGISAFIRRGCNTRALSLPYEDTARRRLAASQEVCPHQELNLPASSS